MKRQFVKLRMTPLFPQDRPIPIGGMLMAVTCTSPAAGR